MQGKIKICDFVKSELKYFEDECNFSDNELECFRLLSQAKSRRQIAADMELSQKKVTDISNKLRAKVKRAQKLKGDGSV